MRRLLGVGFGLGVVLASAGASPSSPVDGSNSKLVRVLSSEGLEIESIASHRFVDLDRDGIQEILVQGKGRAGTGARRVSIPIPREGPRGARRLSSLPSSSGPQPFLAAFQFLPDEFRWGLRLHVPLPGELEEVQEFGTLSLGSRDLIRVAWKDGATIQEQLFLPEGEGFPRVFHVAHGDGLGEGLWAKGEKLLLSRALPDPLRLPRGHPAPGWLQKTRFRWDGISFVEEFWSVHPIGYRAAYDPDRQGLDLPRVLRWAQVVHRRAQAGFEAERLSLEAFAGSLFGENDFQVVAHRGGVALVLEKASGRRPRVHTFLAPFSRFPGLERSAWMTLAEIHAIQGQKSRALPRRGKE